MGFGAMESAATILGNRRASVATADSSAVATDARRFPNSVAADSIAPKPIARERAACKLKHPPQFARALDGSRITAYSLPHPPALSATNNGEGVKQVLWCMLQLARLDDRTVPRVSSRKAALMRVRKLKHALQRTPLRLERGRGEVSSQVARHGLRRNGIHRYEGVGASHARAGAQKVGAACSPKTTRCAQGPATDHRPPSQISDCP